jgi:hypothetical protein
LKDISQAFSNFFSLLNSKAEAESKNFQEHVFLSLLEQKHSDADVLDQAHVEAESRQSVVSVLKDLGVSNAKASRSVNEHYARTNEARANWLHKSQGATVDNAYLLGSSTMDHHLSYVAMTRHRDEMRLYGTPATMRRLERNVDREVEFSTLHFDRQRKRTGPRR